MTPLPPDQWDSSLQFIIDAMDGEPINIHCLLANHPALLKAWWGYRMNSVSGGDLSQRVTEIVILRVAIHMQAWYEWAAHVDRGLAAGLTIEEIERVALGPAADGWSSEENTLLRSIDSLVKDRCLRPALRQELAAFYSQRQILDIISLQGLYVTIASMLGTWSIEVDADVLQRLPATVTEASFAALLSAANGD